MVLCGAQLKAEVYGLNDHVVEDRINVLLLFVCFSGMKGALLGPMPD